MSANRDHRHSASATLTSPLAQYESALRAELARNGYAESSVTMTVRKMRRLSRWMGERGVNASGLTPAVVEQYVAERRRSCRSAVIAQQGIGTVLRFLCGQGIGPDPAQPTPVEILVAAYRDWLHTERGLSSATLHTYGSYARKFLTQLPEPIEESLTRLDAAAVITFVLGQATTTSAVAAKEQVAPLRSLLRFLHVQGLIQAPLAAAVPRVAAWRLSTLPRVLPSAQVQALLGAHDLATPSGLRDHAVLVALTRLGLRGAEIAALRLADVDWHAGEIIVRGKDSHIDRLPLPDEVGKSLANYLTGARPPCPCATLFVTARAPYQPLTPHVVRAIMVQACRLAGLPRLGAHRLRHTLASDLLRAGSSLAEVGQILRHRDQRSTAIYAKVDQESLRMLARPWPGGVR
jgi:integrase/recombinase XerD